MLPGPVGPGMRRQTCAARAAPVSALAAKPRSNSPVGDAVDSGGARGPHRIKQPKSLEAQPQGLSCVDAVDDGTGVTGSAVGVVEGADAVAEGVAVGSTTIATQPMPSRNSVPPGQSSTTFGR